MPLIKLATIINAPAVVCFDTSRSIDLHVNSMKHTNEKAIAGTTTGLIGLGEWVTWQASHLGVKMKMTVKITELILLIFLWTKW